jgi:hypothetical protein
LQQGNNNAVESLTSCSTALPETNAKLHRERCHNAQVLKSGLEQLPQIDVQAFAEISTKLPKSFTNNASLLQRNPKPLSEFLQTWPEEKFEQNANID